MTLHPQALEAARIDAAFDAFLQLQELPYIPGKDPRDAIRAAIATYLEASAPAEVVELVERYSVLLSEDDRGPIATMVVDETGDWVKAAALLALQAKCNARDATIARLREALELAEPQLRALGSKTAGAPIALAAVLTAEAGE